MTYQQLDAIADSYIPLLGILTLLWFVRKGISLGVKSAFIDADLIRSMPLTSANSINIARWLSQMFYYFIAFKNRITPDKKLAVSVPSGNFGNICAGLVAKEMGLPIDQFIASTNINDTVPDYLNSGTYSPKKSKPTL